MSSDSLPSSERSEEEQIFLPHLNLLATSWTRQRLQRQNLGLVPLYHVPPTRMESTLYSSIRQWLDTCNVRLLAALNADALHQLML